MLCSNCGHSAPKNERFCRQCGTLISGSNLVANEPQTYVSNAPPGDPDELTGNGIGSVIVGDGFLMVAVILSATSSSISSLLWLLLLIPAFFFFGKGFADVLHARQIRKRIKHEAPGSTGSLTASSVVDALQKSISGELTLSVTDRTTRNLK